MTTTNSCNVYDNQGDLNRSERVARAGAALIMLIYPMIVSTAPLGLIALLPLIAIYPMYSAIVGWDPARYALSRLESRGVSRIIARAGLGIIGTGLIATTMLTSVNPLGGLVVLALLGILPIFVAIFGENPVTALYEEGQGREQFDQNNDQKQDAETTSVVKYTPRVAENSSQEDHVPTHHEAA